MSASSRESTWAQWVLRLGVSAEFAGHGVFALLGSESFSRMVEEVVGLDAAGAQCALQIIGTLDLVIAAIVLIRPVQAVLLWAALWGGVTALARPLSGSSWWSFVERGANWAAPLALLLLRGWPRSPGDWWR